MPTIADRNATVRRVAVGLACVAGASTGIGMVPTVVGLSLSQRPFGPVDTSGLESVWGQCAVGDPQSDSCSASVGAARRFGDTDDGPVFWSVIRSAELARSFATNRRDSSADGTGHTGGQPDRAARHASRRGDARVPTGPG